MGKYVAAAGICPYCSSWNGLQEYTNNVYCFACERSIRKRQTLALDTSLSRQSSIISLPIVPADFVVDLAPEIYNTLFGSINIPREILVQNNVGYSAQYQAVIYYAHNFSQYRF